MIRQDYLSEIGNIFRSARIQVHPDLDPPGFFYGYVKLTNGVLEIRTEKEGKFKKYE